MKKLLFSAALLCAAYFSHAQSTGFTITTGNVCADLQVQIVAYDRCNIVNASNVFNIVPNSVTSFTPTDFANPAFWSGGMVPTGVWEFEMAKVTDYPDCRLPSPIGNPVCRGPWDGCIVAIPRCLGYSSTNCFEVSDPGAGSCTSCTASDQFNVSMPTVIDLFIMP